MKLIEYTLIAAFIACLAVALVGCDGVTTEGSTTLSSGSGTNAVTAAAPISTLDLSIIQTGATIATGAVLQFAENSPAQRTKTANQIYSSAAGLYTMTGPDAALATPAQFQNMLVSFGLNEQIAGYSSYTADLQSIYAAEYAKYVSGNITASNLSAVINALAQGAQAGASAYITVPSSPLITTQQ